MARSLLIFASLLSSLGLCRSNFLHALTSWRRYLWCTIVIKAVLTSTEACDTVHAVLMTNTVVLLAVILPTIASFPFKWLLKYLPLDFTSFDSTFRLIILTVLALTCILVASLSSSEADAVHFPTLTFRASALLFRFVLELWMNLCQWNTLNNSLRSCLHRKRNLACCLEYLRDLLVNAETTLVYSKLHLTFSSRAGAF